MMLSMDPLTGITTALAGMKTANELAASLRKALASHAVKTDEVSSKISDLESLLRLEVGAALPTRSRRFHLFHFADAMMARRNSGTIEELHDMSWLMADLVTGLLISKMGLLGGGRKKR
jgi:hypothetical protein